MSNCTNCLYYSGEIDLPCAVNPSLPPNCPDFEQRQAKEVPRSLLSEMFPDSLYRKHVFHHVLFTSDVIGQFTADVIYEGNCLSISISANYKGKVLNGFGPFLQRLFSDSNNEGFDCCLSGEEYPRSQLPNYFLCIPFSASISQFTLEDTIQIEAGLIPRSFS